MMARRDERPVLRREDGQVLVMLLAFMAIAITLVSALVVVALANMQAGSKFASGEAALALAESGADQALLRLERDPSYTGETLTLPAGTVTITITGTSTKTITAEGAAGSFHRRIQVTATVGANNIISLSTWSQTD